MKNAFQYLFSRQNGSSMAVESDVKNAIKQHMKKNRTFEEQALHDVREAVKQHHERKGLQLSTSVYPVLTELQAPYTIRIVHKPSDRVWH